VAGAGEAAGEVIGAAKNSRIRSPSAPVTLGYRDWAERPCHPAALSC
jgi:hypothetical protein